jgi:hypothetical protein
MRKAARAMAVGLSLAASVLLSRVPSWVQLRAAISVVAS